MYDVAIIGAGFIGLAAARELSRYNGNICVIESKEEISFSETSGFVYAGFEVSNESIDPELLVQGNKLLSAVSKELYVPFQRTGAAVIRTKKQEQEHFDQLILQGSKSQVPDFKVINAKDTNETGKLSLPDGAAKDAEEIIYAPSAGKTDSFALCAALAENAAENGVDFFFETEVCDVTHGKGYYILKTSNETIRAKAVINTVSRRGDKFHNAVSRHSLHTKPLHLQMMSPDKMDSPACTDSSPILFHLTSEKKKGFFDFLGGSHSDAQSDPGNKNAVQKAVFGEALGAANYFDAYGFGDFAMTAAPAAALQLAGAISSSLGLEKNTGFHSGIREIISLALLSKEEQAALIQYSPSYGEFICEGSTVTKGEVYDVILRAAGPVTAEGVLRRLHMPDASPDVYKAVEAILNQELSLQ